jgi:hypothetical protein
MSRVQQTVPSARALDRAAISLSVVPITASSEGEIRRDISLFILDRRRAPQPPSSYELWLMVYFLGA